MLIPKTKMRLEKKRSTFGGGKRTVALLAEMCDGPHLVRRASSSLVHPPRILKGFAFEVTALGATKSKSSGRKSAGWSPAASAAESANVGARLPNALRGTEGNFLEKSIGGWRSRGKTNRRMRRGARARGNGASRSRTHQGSSAWSSTHSKSTKSKSSKENSSDPDVCASRGWGFGVARQW